MYNCPSCEHNFEIEAPDQISVYNAKARTLSIQCPKCHKNFRLDKGNSEKLIEKFPELEKEIEQALAEKVSRDMEPPSVAGSFEEKFRDALAVFGLNSNKYKEKITAVLKLIERTGATREWLKYHMQMVNFSNRATIESVASLVFLDEDQAPPQPPYPLGGQGTGYSVQTLPSGQIILMPQQAAQPSVLGQPIIIDRAFRDREPRDDGSIIEELDEKGNVTKRIIRQRGGEVAKTPTKDTTLELLTTLNNLGLIQKPQASHLAPQTPIPPEIKETLSELKSAVINLKEKPKGESEEVKNLTSQISKLTEKIDDLERERAASENQALRDELKGLKEQISQVSSKKGEVPAGLTDYQFDTHTRHRNLITITDAADRAADRIATPLNKMLENQSRLNALLIVRDAEKQDGVPPGTYISALNPPVTPTDLEVRQRVEDWQKRAAQARAGA